MNLREYQEKTRKTAQYPNKGDNFVYPTLGLAGETGEVVEKIKKLIRNNDIVSPSQIPPDKKEEIVKELGDVLWYLAQLATELNVTLDDVAIKNLEKLKSREDRGVIRSEGDNR